MDTTTQEMLLRMQQECAAAVVEMRAIQREHACDESQNLLDHWEYAHQAVSSLISIHEAQPERDLSALIHCIHRYMLIHAHSLLSSQTRHITDVTLMATP